MFDSQLVLERWLRDLLDGKERPLGEEERQTLRNDLLSGVNLKTLARGWVRAVDGQRYTYENANANSLKAQAEFLKAVFGRRKMRSFIVNVLSDLISYSGSKIYKASDRSGGRPEPTNKEVKTYVGRMLTRWFKEGFVFSPTTEEKKLFWADNVIHRIEAIISGTYVLLRFLAYDDPMEAWSYQESEYWERNLLVRLKEGLAKDLKASHKPVPEHLVSEEGKIIRHLHPAGLMKIWGELSQ